MNICGKNEKSLFTGVHTSPVNIVATATVVTDEDVLMGDEETENCEDISDKMMNDEDEELDVDVEECSSVDDEPVHRIIADHLSSGASARKYSVESGGTDERKQRLRTSCNSDELRDVECHLETKELWDKFNDLGTEMIITKTGR